jgi:hypothetical protein
LAITQAIERIALIATKATHRPLLSRLTFGVFG